MYPQCYLLLLVSHTHVSRRGVKVFARPSRVAINPVHTPLPRTSDFRRKITNTESGRRRSLLGYPKHSKLLLISVQTQLVGKMYLDKHVL